jgi:hypothetical protein
MLNSTYVRKLLPRAWLTYNKIFLHIMHINLYAFIHLLFILIECMRKFSFYNMPVRQFLGWHFPHA